MLVMGDAFSERLVPDGLWEIVEPLLPEFEPRPQGGGNGSAGSACGVHRCGLRADHGVRVASPVAELRNPAGDSASSVRGLDRDGLWRRLHHAVLNELGGRGVLDWSAAIVDAASVRVKRGDPTDPSPVDRGKPGS